MRRVLMVAYHFPPLSGSSGIQRTLRFCQDLPFFGWQPSVLSTHPRAYENTSADLLPEIPVEVDVARAFALDARRHLSIYNRYPGWIARPDRWLSWLPGGIFAGLRLIRKHRPDVIWSTYPIPSAHLIGYWLSRLSGLPWVADFRDPMAHEGYPTDAATWRSYLKVEQKVFARARRMVFTTPGAARLYQNRYPAQARQVQVIENGYDESSFQELEPDGRSRPINAGKITLLHSGIVYPQWRNPQALFAALRELIDTHRLNVATFRLRFRASQHSQFLATLTTRYGLDDVVQVLPALDYKAALTEMSAADGLLVLQAADCNDQIPAKVYEYIRARRPILGLCGEGSDTEAVLKRTGVAQLAPLESSVLISIALEDFLTALQSGAPCQSDDLSHEAFSRRTKAGELAQLLDQIQIEHLALATVSP